MRIFNYSAGIFLYCLALILLSRLHLPFTVDPIISRVDDLALAACLAAVMHLCYWLLSGSAVVQLGSLLLLTISVQLVVIAEWWHFEFFRDYIHYASLSYASDWREALKGISGFEARYDALIYLAGMIGALLLCHYYWSSLKISSKIAKWLSVVWLSISILLVSLTSYVYIEVNVTNWQTISPIPLEYKNPIMEIVREKYIGHHERFEITENHTQALKKIYLDRGERNPPDAASSSTIAPPRNVILIIIESLRAYEMGEHNGFSLTPHYDRIAEKSFTPKYFYANSNQTIKAEIAAMCGMHDFVVGASISAYTGNTSMRCLPEQLKQLGFETAWFHGAGAGFYNRNFFLPKIGFDHIYDRGVIENDLYAQGKRHFNRHWGVEDPYVYLYALDNLEQIDKPFFAEILSVSNHHPFVNIEKNWDMSDFPSQIRGDMSDVYRRYQHSLYYTDKALGAFWQRFSNSKLYDNTMVVIMGDHGIWLFPNEFEENSPAGKVYESYMRLPLTAYIPGYQPNGPVDVPMSQVDVASLISTLMLGRIDNSFQSKLKAEDIWQLLAGKELEQGFFNPVIASIGDGYFLRMNDKRCFPPLSRKQGCDDYLFRCVESYNKLQDNKQCQSWGGEILYDAIEVKDIETNTSDIEWLIDYFRNVPFLSLKAE